MSTTQLDQVRAEEFAGRTLQNFNDGMLALLISLGHQSRLFDTMAGLEPATSEQIARAAELDERYVQERLAGMTVGGIVEYQPEPETYVLPREHAACLTRAAGPDNLAALTQYAGLFGELEQRALECFRHGGGIPYIPRFQALQAEESAQVHDAGLIDVTLPLVEPVPVLAVSQHHRLVKRDRAQASPGSR
jgi:hypothetical protein